MYLSRLILNPRSRSVRRDIADCQALHRTVMSGFPDTTSGEARAHLGVLHRLETHPRTGRPALLVQSRAEPDWSHLPDDYLLDTAGGPENPACKRIEDAYAELHRGTVLLFRLRANPTKRVSARSTSEQSGAYGKRVDLRGEDELLEWLRRKGEQHGFELLSVRANAEVPDTRANPRGKVTGGRRARSGHGDVTRLTFAATLFEGRLRLTDLERFRTALKEGIGPAKAYGFGLLSIAPA